MNVLNGGKFKECCRCCLRDAGVVRCSLFVGEEAVQLRMMLYECTGLAMEAERGLPEEICVECTMRLRDAFKFRQECRETDLNLRQYSIDIKKETNFVTEFPDSSNIRDSLDDRNSYDDCLLLNDQLKSPPDEDVGSDDVKKIEKPLNKVNKKRKRKKTNVERLTKKLRKLSKLNISLGNGVKDEDVDLLTNGDLGNVILDEIRNGDCKQEQNCDKSEMGINTEIAPKVPEKNIKELYYSSDLSDFPIKKKPKSKPKGQYFCDICGHCVKIKWDLITHFRRHTGEKPYKCETCGKDFAHDAALRTHQKQHTGVKNFICDICGKALSTKDTLMAHRRLHTGELPFTCTTCGRSFRALTNLRSHLKIHTGDKRHPCPVCNKLFYTKSDMRDHARRHTGERPFACSLCPQRFTGKSNFRLHMKIHAGQKDFECPDCPKTFVSRDSLRRHSRTHSGERAFECVECGRKFAHRSSLVSHHAIHSKTKDYVCDICNQRFGYASGLYVHRKKKHNIQSSRLVAPIP